MGVMGTNFSYNWYGDSSPLVFDRWALFSDNRGDAAGPRKASLLLFYRVDRNDQPGFLESFPRGMNELQGASEPGSLTWNTTADADRSRLTRPVSNSRENCLRDNAYGGCISRLFCVIASWTRSS